MYADDTTLIGSVEHFCVVNPMVILEDIITEELNKINTWMEVNKLLVNENRTKLMSFYMPPKHIDALAIRMRGVEIEVVDDFNFLGITIIKYIPKLQIACERFLQ